MRVLFGLFLFFCLIAYPAQTQVCDCPQASQGETTHWGGNEAIVYVESKTYKAPMGVVVLREEPLQDVLVEVFDNPDHLLAAYPKNEKLQKQQRRISACKTGPDGRFCFQNISKGAYEIRASIGSGWNVSYVWVRIDPKSRQAKNDDIKIPMSLGT